MKKYDELVNQAIDELTNNDDLFAACVDELDGWNSFADGYRCYNMFEIDDLFSDCKVSEFLDKLANDFNHTDNYFCDTIWGISSTDDKAGFYRDNTTPEEVFDALLDNLCHINLNWIDSDFNDLMNDIDNYSEEDESLVLSVTLSDIA